MKSSNIFNKLVFSSHLSIDSLSLLLISLLLVSLLLVSLHLFSLLFEDLLLIEGTASFSLSFVVFLSILISDGFLNVD